MPSLDEVSYSRDATIAAVRDYYALITKMYLKESDIIEPPQEGWPNIPSDSDASELQELGKTDEVVSLLRHLPYIRDDGSATQGAPRCTFADWQAQFQWLTEGRSSGEELRCITEGADFCDFAPPHAIGLTAGGRDNQVFLLDTELGIVHWPGCPDEVKYNSPRERIEDDPYDYASENEEEAAWRAEAPAWEITDFFEVLIDQFRKLQFVPISTRRVLNIYTKRRPETMAVIPVLQEIYREHGWPDLERFRKRECLIAVQVALKERDPDTFDPRDDDDDED